MTQPAVKTKIPSLGMTGNPGSGPNGGSLIVKVDKFGAAEKAGIKVGDEILSIHGKKHATAEELGATLASVGVGGVVKVLLVRKGVRSESAVTLLEKRKALALDLEEVDEVLERKIAPAA